MSTRALGQLYGTPVHSFFQQELAQCDKLNRSLEGSQLTRNQGVAQYLEGLLAKIDAAHEEMIHPDRVQKQGYQF